MMTGKDIQFIHLAMRFPTLFDADGISPWNPQRLDAWAAEQADDPAAVAAAQFVLALWNRNCQWECGAFDLLTAFENWDLPHRLGFLEWASRKSLMN